MLSTSSDDDISKVIAANPFECDTVFSGIAELQAQADELTDRILSAIRNNPHDPAVQQLRNQRRQLWDKIGLLERITRINLYRFGTRISGACSRRRSTQR
jgi:uncharacterized protein YdcH (DUF465 family)